MTGRYGHYDPTTPRTSRARPATRPPAWSRRSGPSVDDLQVGDHVFTMGTHFDDPNHKYPGPCQASHAGYLVAAASEVWRVAPEVDLAGASLFHMAGVVTPRRPA